MSVPTTEVRGRGVITIPKSVREANNIQDGQQYSVHDLGDGTLILSPRQSRIDASANSLRDRLIERGASLETMLDELQRVRESTGA